MEPLFRLWWERLDASERGLLKGCLEEGLAVDVLEDADRRMARALADMGFVVEEGNRFKLLGRAWSDFVRHAI
jgi:hypothetical protein